MNAAVRFRVKGTMLYVQPVQPSRAKASADYELASQAPRLARWRPSTGGPNAMLGGLTSMRARSREMIRNNSRAERAKEVLVANIVGTGIRPSFKTADRAFNAVLASAWAEWTDESDADGRLDFYGQQALAVDSMIEGGDCFVRFRVRRPGDGFPVPLQLQILEAEFCPDDKIETAAGGNIIQMGVELDQIGRRVAYWLYRRHPQDYAMSFVDLLTPVRVPASEVLQLNAIERPYAIRGVPWLTRVLIKLKDVDKYDDAQLLRQQIAALFAGALETELPEGTGDEQELFAGQGAADADGVAVASLEPGTIQVLAPGKKLSFNKPPDPGNAYDVFMRQQEQAVAAGAGILYEQLTGDYSKVNDRTWRAAMNEFRRACETWQHQIVVYQLCRPILRRWAEHAILSGRIRPPAGITAATIARADWLPPRWPYINPVQDVMAKKDEIRAGLTSRKREVSEDGYDIEDLDAEIAADNTRADLLGLVFDSDPRKVSNAGLTQARPEGTRLPSTATPSDEENQDA